MHIVYQFGERRRFLILKLAPSDSWWSFWGSQSVGASMVNQSIHVTSVSTKWFIQRFAKYVYIRIIHLPVCEATCTMMYHRSLKPSETFFASISQNHLKPLSVLPGKIEKGLQPRKFDPRHRLLPIKSVSSLGTFSKITEMIHWHARWLARLQR
jgi:hypothetical protein